MGAEYQTCHKRAIQEAGEGWIYSAHLLIWVAFSDIIKVHLLQSLQVQFQQKALAVLLLIKFHIQLKG